ARAQREPVGARAGGCRSGLVDRRCPLARPAEAPSAAHQNAEVDTLAAGLSMAAIASFPCDKAIVAAARTEAPCAKNAEPWILAATILASSMAFIDGTVVNVALPALQRSLGATV